MLLFFVTFQVREFCGNFNARVATALECKEQIDQETDNVPEMNQNTEKLKVVVRLFDFLLL